MKLSRTDGSHNPHAVLTIEQVRELRANRPETGKLKWYQEQANRIGCHRSTIERACNGSHWKESHVT